VPPPPLSDNDQTSAQVELGDAWRDAVEAGLRYWGRLGRLALEGAAVFVPAVTELRPEVKRGPAPASNADAGKTILIEAEAGQHGMGVFLLENPTAEQLSIPVSVSQFVGEDGNEVHPTVTFRPQVITLDPGDQLVVQVTVGIDETLAPDVRYRAEISVPELSAARIPIVVRRRRSTAPRVSTRRNGQTGERKGQAKAETRGS